MGLWIGFLEHSRTVDRQEKVVEVVVTAVAVAGAADGDMNANK